MEVMKSPKFVNYTKNSFEIDHNHQ